MSLLPKAWLWFGYGSILTNLTNQSRPGEHPNSWTGSWDVHQGGAGIPMDVIMATQWPEFAVGAEVEPQCFSL